MTDLWSVPVTAASRDCINSCARRNGAASAFAFLIALGGAAVAQDGDPALKTFSPFVSTTAIENLRECIYVSDLDAENLSRVREFGYNFSAPGGNTSEPSLKIERFAIIDLDGLGKRDIRKRVEALRGGNCETDTKISNISVELVGINRVAVGYHARVDLRNCGSFLGIEYKDDVGSAWGDVSFLLVLNSDYQLEMQEMKVSNSGSETKPFYDIVGKIANIVPFFHPVGLVLHDEISKKIDSFSAGPGLSGALVGLFESDFMKVANGVSTVEQFAKDIELLRPPVWVYDRVEAETGLVAMADEGSTFKFVEAVVIPGDLGVDAYGFKVAEIKLIDELRIPKPRVHKVKTGESLWSIAGEYYVDAKLFSLIERVNGLRGKVIRPGDEVVVPLGTELCGEVNKGAIVLPGDTVWSLKAKHDGFDPTGADFRSGRLDVIYPYELLRLPSQ